MNMEAPELKPCPFCGGECKLDSSEMGAAREVWHFVWCPTCKITGGLRKSSEEALLMWNTRAPQEPQWEQMTEETTFEDGEELLAYDPDWDMTCHLKILSGEIVHVVSRRAASRKRFTRLFRIPFRSN